MKVSELALPGLLQIEPKVFGDPRGFFLESWNRERYAQLGIDEEFVQDNLSLSAQGVLRGLHYQEPNPQGKLVTVLKGQVFDVAVDIRVGSKTFGRAQSVILSEENKKQLYIPAGFAHGFLVMSDQALFFYKCTAYYKPANEGCLLWNDPALGIDWPLMAEPVLSAKDAVAKPLSEIKSENLPKFK
jgi:dTDP-4-dehydrorhamnose 3,5-epimerase